MKTMRALFQKETWIKGMLGAAAVILVFTLNAFVSEAAEGKVIADTAKIRAEASTSSEVVGSTIKGKTVDIVGAVKDSSGTVWYKVPNGNNTYGYIRSDLIETTDEIEITETTASTTTDTSNTSQNTSKPADTVPASIGETAATISVRSAKIRTGASTAHDIVTSLPQGTSVTLIGEANDSSGMKWYQMTCNYNGKTVEGYVRSDLITVGEASLDDSASENGVEGTAEGENTEGGEESEGAENTEEQQETAEPEHNDYEVVYNDETYWLYDNTNGTMMSVTNLLDVVNQVNENNTALQGQVKNEKIVIIILAVIIVLLVITITVLLFKLRDAYYYEDYEEEEEIEEEPEPVVPKKKKKRVQEEEVIEEPAPAKKKKVRESEPAEPERPVKKKPVQDAELQAAEKKQPVKKTSARKSQNFLVDDDEFEFEFLNMDDKDL